MTLTDTERWTLHNVLQHYHRLEYHRVTDYDKVIDQRQEVTEGVWMYPCPLQPIYLDANYYAVTYDKQYVIDGDYYYDFNEDTELETAGTYTYINPYEWKRGSEYGGS